MIHDLFVIIAGIVVTGMRMNHDLFLVIAGIVIFALLGFRRMLKTHGAYVLIWRHFSGHTYDGKDRTNAGWFTPATKVHASHGRALTWHRKPRAWRAAVRTGCTLGALVVTWGLVEHRQATILAFLIAGTLGAGGLAWFHVRRVRAWLSKRGIVSPLALAMAPILDIPDQETEQAITLAPGWMTRKQGEIGRVTLPSRFRANPGQRDAIEHLIATRLPVDVDFHWNTAQNPQRLSIVASCRPPLQVPFSKYADFMHELKYGEVMLGLDRLEQPYTGMLGNNSDNPHWGLSVNTGRGKSTMLVSTAVQVLHQDADAKVLGIDPKMSSLDAIADIPGVTLACDPLNIEQMWTEIDRYHADMMQRLAEYKRDKLAEFPIHLCMLDEANTCASMWRGYWASIKNAKDPATPPIWKAIAEIAWMGRAARKNLVIVGQRLDPAATGGQGMRDSLGLIGLGGVRANQYKMLVDSSGTAPRFPKIKGRWLYFDSNETTWVQNLLPSADDLRTYAMHGRRAVLAA